MNPSVPELNLNWGFTPQQEQNLSVSKGMEAIASRIDESVRKKIEQDRQYDENLNNILKSTTGRYQKEILDQINKSKEEIKNIGKVNWNNAELRMKRSEILQDLTSVSQKANYVAQMNDQWKKAINDNKYITKEEATNALLEELKKNIKDVDITKLEDIASGKLYVDHKVKIMDATDRFLGKDVGESLPFTQRNNGMLVTGQFQFRKNYVAEKNPDGTFKVDPTTKMPILKPVLTNNDVDQIIGMTGDYNGTYDYFRNMYETANIPNKIKDNQGDSYKEAVLNFARNYIDTVTHAYDYKHLGSTREYVPRTSTSGKAAENEQAAKNQDVNALISFLKNNEKNSIQNRVEQYYKGASNFIIAKWKRDSYYKEAATDRVLSIKEMIKSGKLKPAADGFTIKPEFKDKYSLFTGVAFTIPRGIGGSRKAQYYAFDGQFDNDTNIQALATSIHNGTWKKGNVPFTPTDTSGGGQEILAYENYSDQEWSDIYNSLPAGAQYTYKGEVRIKGQ